MIVRLIAFSTLILQCSTSVMRFFNTSRGNLTDRSVVNTLMLLAAKI